MGARSNRRRKREVTGRRSTWGDGGGGIWLMFGYAAKDFEGSKRFKDKIWYARDMNCFFLSPALHVKNNMSKRIHGEYYKQRAGPFESKDQNRTVLSFQFNKLKRLMWFRHENWRKRFVLYFHTDIGEVRWNKTGKALYDCRNEATYNIYVCWFCGRHCGVNMTQWKTGPRLAGFFTNIKHISGSLCCKRTYTNCSGAECYVEQQNSRTVRFCIEFYGECVCKNCTEEVECMIAAMCLKLRNTSCDKEKDISDMCGKEVVDKQSDHNYSTV